MCSTTFSILWFRLLLLLLFFLSLVFSSSTAPQHHYRRILHQPLFPRISIPPTQPPTSSPQPQPKQQQQPKLPFSSTSSSSSSSSSPQKPFFPSIHTPPLPPSPPVLATFPANISSLLLPHTYSRNHRPAVAVAVSVSLLSLALLAAATAFAYHRRRLRHAVSAAVNDGDDDKASRSDSLRLFPPNIATSDGADRKPRGGASSPRSEFLYLGNVAGSEDARRAASDSSCSSNGGYRKLGDSPELKPLPPLPRHNFRAWRSEEEEEEDDEQFFSPRGSSGHKQQSPPSPSVRLAESSSRSLNHMNQQSPFQLEKFGSRSFTSRTPSYPRSNSLSNSVSRSPSLNLSPRSVKSLPPQNPASSTQSPSFSSSSSSPKLREDLSSSWDVSAQGMNSQVIKLPPPPPPPPPPPRFWETPVIARLAERSQNVGVGDKNESEETPKPKLKALHWDKVKASSDRATVWDRLRPSSFQLNEDMIETLFMVNNSKENSAFAIRDNARRQVVHSSPMPPENRVLDPKKSQNIAILLRALNVTIDEVCDALREGDGESLCILSSMDTAATKKKKKKGYCYLYHFIYCPAYALLSLAF